MTNYELAALRARLMTDEELAELRELHQRAALPYCIGCGSGWPCEQSRLLDSIAWLEDRLQTVEAQADALSER